MASPFPNESALAETVPSFFKNKAIKTTPIRTIKNKNETYSNPYGYFTDYSPYFQWQAQNQWCWLAVAASLGNFRRKNSTYYSQQWLANVLLGGQYNSPGDPARSMEACQCFAGREPNPIQISSILSQLLYTRPLVMGFSTSYTTSHAAVISAAVSNNNNGYFVMDDPWYGPGKQVYINNISNSPFGTWHTTFFYAGE